MIKQAQPDQPKALAPSEKKTTSVVIMGRGSRITAFLAHADEVVERQATKALNGRALRQSGIFKIRLPRAPHLSSVERELNELKKVVEALAVRSIAQDRAETSIDVEGMTVLDAEMAYQLLDNPPEPHAALRNLLALR